LSIVSLSFDKKALDHMPGYRRCDQPDFSAYIWPNCFRVLLYLNEASATEIALQRPDLELASEIGLDAQCRRNGP
jgi:hypothetical protein